LGLDLSHNKIESLTRTAFEYLIHLEEINLSGNTLKLTQGHSTATAIGSLPKLINLNLSDTRIEKIPRHFFKGLRYLKTLDISKNNFHAVPPQLHYDGLEELIIDGNPIAVLKSHSFSAMTSLKKLSICNMPNLGIIKEVAFSGLRTLSILHIDNNPMLGFIDPDAFVDFQFPMVLKTFTLSHNFLRYLPNTLLPELKLNKSNMTLEVVKIEGNQWECDCHNQWLLDLMSQETFEKFAKNAKCTRPKKFKGYNFIEAKNEELPCEDQMNFDPKRKDFGKAHPPAIYNRGEKHMIILTIALGCILAMIGSIVFVFAIYVKEKRTISYKRVSGFKFHFQKRDEFQSSRISTSSLGNNIYRDNPTTVPIDT